MLYFFSKFFKSIAERGDQSILLQEAVNAYERDNRGLVFLRYSMASEQGFEVAQNNFAYLLDEGELRSIYNNNIDTSRLDLRCKVQRDPYAQLMMPDRYGGGEETMNLSFSFCSISNDRLFLGILIKQGSPCSCPSTMESSRISEERRGSTQSWRSLLLRLGCTD